MGRCRPCLQARGLFLLPAGAGVGACLLLAVGAGRRRRGRRGGISRPAGRTQYREYRRAARGRALGMRMQHRSRRRGIRRSGLPAARMWTCTARTLGSGVPVVDSVLDVSAAHLFTDSTRSFLSSFPCVVVVFSSPSRAQPRLTFFQDIHARAILSFDSSFIPTTIYSYASTPTSFISPV